MLALGFMTGCAPAQPAQQISPKEFETIKQACAGRDGWSDPAPPAHVFANTYMVGTCGIVSLLVTTPDGHMLIDGATVEAAPLIAENIRVLGLDPKQVRYLLATHAHPDHVGGLAELKRITGAEFVANTAAKTAMETGKPHPTDPQLGALQEFEGIKADELVEDLGSLSLGRQSITLITTPGHTPGGSSWTWQACEGKICRQIVYADSLSAVSADSYRFSDHPEYVATLRASIARIETLEKCDILISPHPAQSSFFERLAGEAPLVDPTGCVIYAEEARERLDTRLAKEAAE